MDSGVQPGLDDVRRYLVDKLNRALRRPGMWGTEITLQVLLDAVAYVDGLGEIWRREQDDLTTSGAFTSVGVRGAFAKIGYDDTGAVASVYADIAWRRGWLTVDRLLPDVDHHRLRAETAPWCARDRSLDEVLSELGPPSVLCGGGNPRYSTTLAYAAADREQGLVWLYFAATYDWEDPTPQPDSQPVLAAVRHGAGRFVDTFTFTPAGVARRSLGRMAD